MAGSRLHSTFRNFTTFTLDGTSVRVCPSLTLFLVAAVLNAGNSLALFGLVLLVLGYLALWLVKLQVQLWLARRMGLTVAQMHLVPFASRIDMAPGGAPALHRDVHLVGLCVLFGVWSVLSLVVAWGNLSAPMEWMLSNLGGVALVSGLVALLPILGLDGGQALRAAMPARLGRMLEWSSVVGQALAVAVALFLGLMALLALGRGDGAELALALALLTATIHVARTAHDFGQGSAAR